MSEQYSLSRGLPEVNYGFSVRDNLDPIVLVWEDLVAEGGICGDMPTVRENYKDLEVIRAAYLSQADTPDFFGSLVPNK
jgi:hypothetical protein